MLVDHHSIRPSAGGVAFVAVLLLAVARGRVFAWALLLIWNAFLLLSVLAVSGGSWLPGMPLLALNAFLCLALQLAPSMRAHLGLRRKDEVTGIWPGTDARWSR
jgi:hypothetical protein